MIIEQTDSVELEVPPLIPAPAQPAEWPAWRAWLARWRTHIRQALSYEDALYAAEAFQWVPATYACGFVFMYDGLFYDPRSRCYTVEDLLAQAAEALGGYDAVVLWHAYPRLGFDARNQFDFYRDMPGGLPGLREVCRRFQTQGCKVFLNYNPWDTATRREGRPDIEVLIDLVQALDADGLFLDTLAQGAVDLRTGLSAARPGAVLESEGALALADVYDHHMSWAQHFTDTPAPGVLRNTWFERRHKQHLICRWKRDHSAELHTAWMNGSGLLVWENVFGTWVGWNARDRSLLRSMLPIQRRYTGLFTAGEWTPLVETGAPDVYASLWQRNGLRLWTLVNRREALAEGRLLSVPHAAGTQYFDLMAGREVRPAIEADLAHLAGAIGPRGLGAVLAVAPAQLEPDMPRFLERQASLHQRASSDTTFPARTAQLTPVAATTHFAADALPGGMAALAGVRLEMQTELRVRECGFYEAQSPEPLDLPYLHTHKTFGRAVHLAPYAIDLAPVTNAQYAEFLRATGYQPEDLENFLRHWQAGPPPPGLEDHPVVHVDLNDARSYARWAGKRLPTDDEWQYAAQGPEGRRYPWGDTLQAGVCNDGSSGGTTPVRAYPDGRSACGCYDLCGNVWQWTESERSDGRTRFCLLRGGAYYQARSSDWYADGGVLPASFAAKFLLLAPGLDRCATIGFRCAADLTSEPEASAVHA